LAAVVSPADAMWSTLGSSAVAGSPQAPPRARNGDSAVAISQPAAKRLRAKAVLSQNNAREQQQTAALCETDALAFLASYPWRGDELVYCDPPYLLETRTSRRRYLFEMDTLEHQALLDILLQVPANVMVSGYYSALYASALKDWRLVTLEAITRCGTMRTEHLWCNFPEPVELHDYRYLGRNHRERQDLNRMRKRWISKLAMMPLLKRRALFAALKEFHDRNTTAKTDVALRK
jgi:DNA adenine methylase